MSNENKVVLPEPDAVVQSKLGDICSFRSVSSQKGDKLYTEQQVRALLATATGLPAQAVENDNFKREIYAALGCGSEAAEIAAITGIQNLIRREACLSAVERQFFMVETPPDELEGDTEPGEECLLKWGQEPEQYAEQFGAALRLIAPQAQADARDAKDRECLAIGRALNRAALELPADGEIRIEIENGAGVVYVNEPKHGDWRYIDSGDAFSAQINEAIDATIAAAKEQK